MQRLGLVALVLFTLTPAPRAFAAGGGSAICVMMSHLSFSPGITSTSQRVASSTHGETGAITCTGTVNGHQVTGGGTIGFEGFFDISCVGGTGTETVSMTIPTTAGPEKLSFVVNETVLPGSGYKTGDPLVGMAPFVYYPSQGNCVTSPVTEVFFSGTAVLNS
jgi:hypothetical protein